LRPLYANRFGFRSPEKKRESLLLAAFSNPGKAQNGILRAHIFPLQPAAKDSWNAVIALGFPLVLEGSGEVSQDFGAVLVQGTRIVHSFDRRIIVRSRGTTGGARQRQVSFLEPVVLKPGEYNLRVVLSNPEGGVRSSWAETIQVPDLPGKGTFLVGPVLGRPAGKNLVVKGSGMTSTGKKAKESESAAREDVVGGAGSIEPLLVQQAMASDTSLAAMTAICEATSGAATGPLRFERRLIKEGSGLVEKIPPTDVVLEDRKRPRCETLVDLLPTSRLAPGDYVFEVLLDGTGKDGVSQVAGSAARFGMLPAAGQPSHAASGQAGRK